MSGASEPPRDGQAEIGRGPENHPDRVTGTAGFLDVSTGPTDTQETCSSEEVAHQLPCGRWEAHVKGIIFNLLEGVVVDDRGEDAWDELLERAGVDGAYTSVGSYDDLELIALLHEIDVADAHEGPATMRWFGRKAMPLLACRYPGFFAGHASTVDFLYTLNDIIHAEVRKLYADADVPTFDFSDYWYDPATATTGLTLGYHSARKFCALAEGFIEGAAEQFNEAAVIEQPGCMLRGDDRCVLVCTFSQRDAGVRHS